MTTKQYVRSKKNFETAAEAWADLVRRSDLSDSFGPRERDHTGSHWKWQIEIEDGGDDE